MKDIGPSRISEQKLNGGYVTTRQATSEDVSIYTSGPDAAMPSGVVYRFDSPTSK